MADTTQKASSKKVSKKEARKLVSEKIAGALAEYKSTVKEKKFSQNLRKASKLFAADIAKGISKQKQQLKKPGKINAVKNHKAEESASSEVAV